jgi:hypothetical protein
MNEGNYIQFCGSEKWLITHLYVRLDHSPISSSTEGMKASDEKFSTLPVLTAQTRDGREIVGGNKQTTTLKS